MSEGTAVSPSLYLPEILITIHLVQLPKILLARVTNHGAADISPSNHLHIGVEGGDRDRKTAYTPSRLMGASPHLLPCPNFIWYLLNRIRVLRIMYFFMPFRCNWMRSRFKHRQFLGYHRRFVTPGYEYSTRFWSFPDSFHGIPYSLKFRF